MSQQYFSGGGSSAGEGSSRDPQEPSRNPFLPRPNYMSVGGTPSRSAEALITRLNSDSGYGGSIASGSDDGDAWRAGLMEDRPMPLHPEHEKQAVASHVHQLL